MKQSTSSKRWLKEHFSDQYVQQAHKLGLRSRAYFKLAELDKSEKLFKHGMIICDLGAAPGGWSQYLSKKLANHAEIFALDILPMPDLPGVDFTCGDFTEQEILEVFNKKLANRKVNAVISDMAPNFCGIKQVDNIKAMYLAELALDFAFQKLAPGGLFLTKVFQGTGFDAFLKETRNAFTKVKLIKPAASRDRSCEVYLLAKGFKL